MTAYVAAGSVTRDWINASPIAVPGGPLRGGAHVVEPKSPGVGAWALVMVLGATEDRGDANLHAARISVTVHAGQPGAAEIAAVAYANLLRATADGGPVELPGAILHTVANITGPGQIPVPGVDQWMVDADFVYQPAAP